jgi:hypothetical protein
LKRFILISIAAFTVLVACTKDRDFPDNTQNDVKAGDVVINEYAVNGATLTNEFGNTDDWIELFNTTSDTAFIKQNRFYLSDDETDPYKYTVTKDTFITPGGYLLVFADGLDTIATQIHTNFSLSAAGESISLWNLNSQNQAIEVDTRTFGAQPSGQSEGRSPDGSNTWLFFTTPTPGASNQ